MPNNQLVYNKLNQKASKLEQLAFIYQEVASRMEQRLDYIKMQPKTILDLGSGLDIDAKLLAKRYPAADLYKLDLSDRVLNLYGKPQKSWFKLFNKNKDLICGDANLLPFKPLSMNMIWSNLLLPHITTLKELFNQIYTTLNWDGMCLLSGLGVDTFKELREAGLSTYNFPDMHLIGDLLIGSGFSDPVTDVEYIKLEYDRVDHLLSDVRVLGLGAWSNQVNHLSKTQYLNLKDSLHQINGKYTLTLELFYAHAWKSSQAKHKARSEQIIQFYPKVR